MNEKELLEISEIQKNMARKVSLVGFQHRDFYELLKSDKSVVIIGPRRIGKTTLLEQVIRDYNEEQLGSTMYLKMDSIEFASLDENELKQLTIEIKRVVINNNIKTLLIDEVQSLPNWTILLKDIKDLLRDEIRIMCTGSNSNKLMESSESGVGRFSIMIYGVLSLREYSKISNINEIKEVEHFYEYMEYKHFPHYSLEDYYQEVPEAVIEKAFSASEKTKRQMHKLIKWIALNPGLTLNATNVASNIEVPREYIHKFLSELYEGQIIYKLGNVKKTSGQEKVYPLIPGLFTIYNGGKYIDMESIMQGHLFESFVLIQLLSLTKTLFQRTEWSYLREGNRNKFNEIDFVYNNIGFEVKRTFPSEYKKYVNLCIRNNIKTLYFVVQNQHEYLEEELNGVKIKIINWYDFANEDIISKLKQELNIR